MFNFCVKRLSCEFELSAVGGETELFVFIVSGLHQHAEASALSQSGVEGVWTSLQPEHPQHCQHDHALFSFCLIL